MKLIFCILAFYAFTIGACSQEMTDTVNVRVLYQALYKHTEEQKDAFDDTDFWSAFLLYYVSFEQRV